MNLHSYDNFIMIGIPIYIADMTSKADCSTDSPLARANYRLSYLWYSLAI